MNKQIYKIAIKFLKKTYNNNYKSNKSTQWNSYVTYYNNQPLQVLSIAGTNDIMDWVWNFCLLSKDGVKYGSYISANRVLKDFIRKPNIPLLITCHSKSGPTGIYLQELLNAEYCIVFCPARGFTEEKRNERAVMFIDKDDIVPKLGWSIFYHRKCKTIFLQRDKKWYDIFGKIQDHLLDHIEDFIDRMK